MGFTPCKAERPLGMELQEKESQEAYRKSV